MMMPPLPGAHLGGGQARLPCGTLQRFVDAMLGLDDTGERAAGRWPGSGREAVIMLPRTILLPRAKHHQELCSFRWLAFGSRRHQPVERWRPDRIFRAIAYLDRLPGVLW